MAKRIRGESGYSLVEVMISIMIMAIAILPMVGMFDMGLNTTTVGSNYDKARTLANMKLEQAKNLSFEDVEGNFPAVGDTTPYDEPDTWLQGEDEDVDFTGFEYRVVKQYMEQPPTAPTEDDTPWEFPPPSDTATDLIRVTVIVQWGNGNTYTTHGLVTG
jgi:prepilin-type N-terminal cleavage/methylation domain-containing protein